MKKTFCILLTLAMLLALSACASSTPAAPTATEAPTTAAPATEAPTQAAVQIETVKAVCDGSAKYKLEAEERDLKMGWDGTSFFAGYFNGDTKTGVTALIDAGAVTVNGFPADVDAAARAMKTSGANVTLTLENGVVTKMELSTTAAILVDTVAENEDGTVTVTGDGQQVVVPASNLGEGVAAYTVCVYWEDPDGMHMELADRRMGTIAQSGDHDFLVMNIDGKEVYFNGADMYPRGGSAGNRPGGYANTADRMEVNEFACSAWLIPGTMGTDNEMIIMFTSENPRERLQAVIDHAQALVDMTVIAQNEEEAATKGQAEFHWLKAEDTAVLDGLKEAIVEAQEALADENTTLQEIDNTAYELYIAVWGSNSDVSAVFMGTARDGFYDKADGGAFALPAAKLF